MSELSAIAACFRGRDDPFWQDRKLKCSVRWACRGVFRQMLRNASAKNPKVTWAEDNGWFSSDFIVEADWKTWYIINELADQLNSVNYEELKADRGE